jgi:hypothetical protein
LDGGSTDAEEPEHPVVKAPHSDTPGPRGPTMVT